MCVIYGFFFVEWKVGALNRKSIVNRGGCMQSYMEDNNTYISVELNLKFYVCVLSWTVIDCLTLIKLGIICSVFF